MRYHILCLLPFVAIALPGCSTLIDEGRDPERSEQVRGIDKHSSYPAVRRDYFEKINLIELVDPGERASVKFKKVWDLNSKEVSDNDLSVNQLAAKYDLVLSWFRQTDEVSDEDKKRRRNGIQERILSVSTSRCNVFKTYLRRDQADKNFLLGSLTTASAMLGAIMQGANASRNLSGTAGIFSGIRSEYNQAYYASLAAHVIVKGIETRQEIAYRQIQDGGQSKSIDDYPLEAAIKDALYFDGLCSVVAGLDQAAASVDATLEPGLDAATRTLLRARLMEEASNLTRAQVLDPKTLDQFSLAGSRLGMFLVGSARGAPVPTGAEVDIFITSENIVKRVNAAASSIATEIAKSSIARIKELKSDVKLSEDEISKAVGEKTKEFVGELSLDKCYSEIAAKRVLERDAAVKKRDQASEDENKRIAAELEIRNALRAIETARDELQQKEKLALFDLDTYRQARLKAIKGLQKIGDKKSINDAATGNGPEKKAASACK